MSPISDRPSSPFEHYQGTDATLIVFQPRPKSQWVATATTVALFVTGVAVYAWTSRLLPLVCCGVPLYAAILLLVLGRARLTMLVVERAAIALVQKRYIDSDYITRIRFPEVKSVSRGPEPDGCSRLKIETITGKIHEIAFAIGEGEKRQPRFELVLNHTATKFPEGGLEPCATTAALCTALAALGLPVEPPNPA